jgi:hypothetical protein
MGDKQKVRATRKTREATKEKTTLLELMTQPASQ